MGHANICILWFGVFAVPCYAVLHCLCQAMYASFYSTPTLRGSKTDGQPQIIVVNEMLRWRKEVMAERAVQDEEKDGGEQDAGPRKAVARESMSHCNSPQ